VKTLSKIYPIFLSLVLFYDFPFSAESSDSILTSFVDWLLTVRSAINAPVACLILIVIYPLELTLTISFSGTELPSTNGPLPAYTYKSWLGLK